MHDSDDDRKRALREEVWQALRDAGVARFPGTRGRIPNFTGAESAAERLRGLDLWTTATTVKSNPDSPQWPVRQRALEDGMTVFIAVPRLREERPFLRLDPERLDVRPRAASSIKGSAEHGVPVGVDELEPVDLVVVGCVAVDRSGARLGKGGGFADLEFALASAARLIGPQTTVVTTVHPLQMVADGRIPMTGHDVPLDVIVTPDEVITCASGRERPAGILWDHLPPDKVDEIPLLRRLAAARRVG
ncbi:MAG: 5-formyltetrahydrofolate cyclo-ligase [Actinobacteria bacterium]|nr:5-formyltetrahydrofolate cyclo-ligase [Actinomycetota bacterium]